MIKFNVLMEKINRFRDVKNNDVKKKANQLLKTLDKGEILAYSIEHDEFTKFDNDKEFKDGNEDGEMKWVKVNEAFISEAFDFNKAVKTGNLEKSDKTYIDKLESKGYKIDAFELTSSGFALYLMKGKKIEKFIGTTPIDALQKAIKKLK